MSLASETFGERPIFSPQPTGGSSIGSIEGPIAEVRISLFFVSVSPCPDLRANPARLRRRITRNIMPDNRRRLGASLPLLV